MIGFGIAVGDVGNNGTSNVDYAASIAEHIKAAPTTHGPFADGGANPLNGGYDFDQSYDAINGLNYESVFSRYTVHEGDTLETIAIAVWGDASYWYLIADANGLFAGDTLVAGRDLIIPNKVHNSHNTSDVFRVYDPNDAIGDTSPTRPKLPKHQDGGCGVAGQIILVVIAVVVTAILAPELTPLLGDVLGTMLAATAGDTVSQGIGVATGIQSKFDWGHVAMTAITAGVTQGLGVPLSAGGQSVFQHLDIAGTTFAEQFAQGALANAVSQGIGMATGLQRRFDWTGVAAAGVVRGTSTWVAGQISGTIAPDTPWLDRIGTKLISGMAGAIAGATTRTLVQGTDFGDNLIAVLPDVIGSTIGDTIGDAVADPLAAYRNMRGSEISRRLVDEAAAQTSDPDGFREYLAANSSAQSVYDNHARLILTMIAHPEAAGDPEALRHVRVEQDDLPYPQSSDPKIVIVRGSETFGNVVVLTLSAAQRGINVADEHTAGFASVVISGVHGGPIGAFINWGIGKGVGALAEATGAGKYIANATESGGAYVTGFFEDATYDDEMSVTTKPGYSAEAREVPMLIGQAIETIIGISLSAIRPTGRVSPTTVARDGGAITREAIVSTLGKVVQPQLKAIAQLDDKALVGFRGSLARGVTGPHKGGGPFNPADFDVDAFIVSDKLASQLGNRPFRSGTRIPEIAAVQRSIEEAMRQNPIFAGLRTDKPFTFRIFTSSEIANKVANGDSQYYFIH